MQARTRVNAPVQPLAVSASPLIGERILKSPLNEDDEGTHGRSPGILTSTLSPRRPNGQRSNLSIRSASSTFSRAEPSSPRPGSGRAPRPIPAPDPIITISAASNPNKDSVDNSNHFTPSASRQRTPSAPEPTTREDDEDLDYVTVDLPGPDSQSVVARPDKASRVLGIRHRKEMEPIPASNRTSLASARSARSAPPTTVTAPPPATGPTLPLASLYVVSGLPKSPHTWTLADPDSVMGLHHTEGAVGRWWRPEVLGSTVSPGAGGGGKRKKKGKHDDGTPVFSSQGHLSKQDVGKMLSKALKVRPRIHMCIAPTNQLMICPLRLLRLSLFDTDSSPSRAKSRSSRRRSSPRPPYTPSPTRSPHPRRPSRRRPRPTSSARPS